MERTADADAAASSLLEGMPQQRPGPSPVAAPREPACDRLAVTGATGATGAAVSAPAAPPAVSGLPDVVSALGARLRGLRPRRLLPSPTGTPFTCVYAAILLVTSLVSRYADPATVNALYQSCSTDVSHLVRTPLLVLPASALWIAGGITSPYSLCFLLVLTALERRTGGLRTAGVFLAGHVLATLATEVPIGLAVLAGRLPDSALHRLDYGISFGVAASVGALAGLLTPWLRWPLLTVFVGMVLADLLTFTDPMTSSGHLISVGVGVASWPLVRRWHRAAR
ncbi:rhomboid-like protein [Streptomyces carpinensis]|uniref:Rhomboid-like protein n=1 Tax=Streptomyces carpinensis TaxID=66369 RepID=A0ABV1W2H7_9ACTN|nr:rhomboid-like protein [Streptomyces carpinensis]